jgi:hypothetical protein
LQSSIEADIFKKQSEIESQAKNLLQSSADSSSSPAGAAASLLGDFHEQAAVHIRETWTAFFWAMVTKYRDMMM